jgi:CheY-like chemotaxis protein
VSHGIISKHDGHISVTSKQGSGATFTIWLPASDLAPKERERPEPGAGGVRQATVMIMDDDESVRAVARSMVARIGHEAIVVSDGTEAVETYRERRAAGNPVDLIIMDLTIPGGRGGKETVRDILDMDPEARVIVSSGYSTDPIMANCEEYGFRAAVAKPYSMQELKDVIRRVLS